MNEAGKIYDTFAEAYLKRTGTSSYNDFYERPAMVALLGDGLEGKRILDVGCASGWYLEYGLERGAEMVGVDASEKFVEKLQERFGERAPVHHALIEYETPFLKPGSFDIVLCSLVLHYIQDLDPVMEKFQELLRPGGMLLFSTHHPISDFPVSKTGNYYETEFLREAWASFGIEMVYYRRSFSSIFQPVMDHGFELLDIVETQPLPELEERDPRAFKKLSSVPPFIFARCRRK